MSAFARRQSKVFWRQMESHDLGDDCPSFAAAIDSRTVLSTVEDESDEDKYQTDGEDNVTAVRIHSSWKEQAEETDGKREELDKDVEAATSASFSPVSHDHRSLDSGFSDSERSEGSGTEQRNSRVHRRKKKRTKRCRDARLDALWREGDVLPNPAHTSTPKQSNAARKLEEELSFSTKEDSHLSRISDNEKEESLGDFLYSTDPPQDSSGSRIAETLLSSTLNSDEASTSQTRENLLSPVRAWLRDIAYDVEDECTATLQSKSLPKSANAWRKDNEDVPMLTSAATATATKLLLEAGKFDKFYNNVVDKLSSLESDRSDGELIRSLEDYAFRIIAKLGASPPRRIQQSNLQQILSQLQNLKRDVDGALDTRLDFYTEKVIQDLEEAPSVRARGALAALTALGSAGTRASSSIARCSGVRVLLMSLLPEERLSSELRAACLRALATVCCCSIAIERFAADDGPEILVNILRAKTSPTNEKIEAAALVVQLTAPWTNHMGLRHLEPLRESIVGALIELAENCSSSFQALLLAAAALNNLAKSSKCAVTIDQYDVVHRLLACVKKSGNGNVCLMEQMASLVGELARIPQIRGHLAKTRVSVALISFLRMLPPGVENNCSNQKLRATTTGALIRLCEEPEIAKQVVALGGNDCLPIDDDDASNEEQVQKNFSFLRQTKSLRIAQKKAAKLINFARGSERTKRSNSILI